MKKLFASIVSKFKGHKILQKVIVNKEGAVASDSFVCLEIKGQYLSNSKYGVAYDILANRTPEGMAVTPGELNLPLKILNLLPTREDTLSDFPKFQDLIPTPAILENDYVSITVNPEKLAHIAKAMHDVNAIDPDKGYDKVVMYVHKTNSNKAVLLQREDLMATALVMPVNN